MKAYLHIELKPNQEFIDLESNSFAIGFLLYCYLYVFCTFIFIAFVFIVQLVVTFSALMHTADTNCYCVAIVLLF